MNLAKRKKREYIYLSLWILFWINFLFVIISFCITRVLLPAHHDKATILPPLWFVYLRMATFTYVFIFILIKLMQTLLNKNIFIYIKIAEFIVVFCIMILCCLLGMYISIAPTGYLEEIKVRDRNFRLTVTKSDTTWGQYRLYKCEKYGFICYLVCESEKTMVYSNEYAMMRVHQKYISIEGEQQLCVYKF